MVLINFEVTKEIREELKILAARESRTIKDILTEVSVDYIKVHKEGNPQHLMDNFLDNVDMRGYPALGARFDEIKGWFERNKDDEKLMQDLHFKLQEWNALSKEI